MAYQVIARKWRPQTFDAVVGQQAVTRTLCNALASGRLAQAFVFAGPRGVGKTTTARILARALNCEHGPTAEPCGVCDACREIAEGRDIDVLEIDAATHTGVDNVREVIIAGLSILPVRNRYKIFIVDEVHQLSTPSFNALLKSIEEPPPHVVFMMATTELDKIPETVLSRSQVYEFRAIGTKQIADQLRAIVDAEGVEVADESLLQIARDADGSMRDAESKLDQVIAFTGNTIAPNDVSTVLGLVGRDLLLNTLEAVANEDAVAAFSVAGHAVDMGYDLRLVCRELSRAVRDLLVLSVDPSRANDPEIAGDGERDRLLALARRFSREDLLRSFDLLTRAEFDIRHAAQPRYHLEMVLLRWIHVRKLVAIEDLIQQTDGGATRPAPAAAPARSVPAAAPSAVRRPMPASPAPPPAAPFTPTPTPVSAPVSAPVPPSASVQASERGGLKDAFLSEVRKSSPVLYNTVVAQAQRMDTSDDRIVLVFEAAQKIGPAFEKYRPQMEAVASRIAGRKVTIAAETVEHAGSPDEVTARQEDAQRKSALREQALGDTGVQALLDVFPAAEIRDVEEA
ncbi:MAG: DNA polymerase III subunit gamma/tau [Acidobacteriaceae bacterium]|jgi:DNA polymerase-3 subunit gamma/tau|nr:DNA polymerase III subunit gamma/tau [Acidobacteriaceae bacterium]